MELGPIWRAILRNKGSYLLIALQIAVTMAVMVNSIAIMQERASQMARRMNVSGKRGKHLATRLQPSAAQHDGISP